MAAVARHGPPVRRRRLARPADRQRRARPTARASAAAPSRRRRSSPRPPVMVVARGRRRPPGSATGPRPRSGIPTGDTWSAMQDDLDARVAPLPGRGRADAGGAAASWSPAASPSGWSPTSPTGRPSGCGCPSRRRSPPARCSSSPALLGEAAGRGWAVALFAGAAASAFLLLHRLARQDGSSHWVADRRVGRQPLAAARRQPGSGSLAVRRGHGARAGRARAPSPPGCSTRRRSAATTRGSTVSPLVDIRSRLVEQAERRGVPGASRRCASYWRLTSLEEFDGRIWTSSGSFGSADGELPESVDGVGGPRGVRAVVHDRGPRGDLAPERLRAPGPRRRRRRGALRRGVGHAHRRQRRHDQRRPHLPGDVAVAPHHARRTSSGTADEIPGDIRDDYLDLPDGFSPRVQSPRRTRSSTAPRPPPTRRAPCRTTCATLHVLARRAAGPQRGRARGLPLREPGRATASSSPAPSRRWRARSGCPRASPSASPPASEDPTTPAPTSCAASTPTPGPRCTSPAPAGSPTSPRPDAACPNAEAYTGVPGAAGRARRRRRRRDRAHHRRPPRAIPPDDTPTAARDRDPMTELVTGDEAAGEDGGIRLRARSATCSGRSLRALPIVLGLVRRVPVLFPLGLCSCGAGAADGGPTRPLEQVAAGVDREPSRPPRSSASRSGPATPTSSAPSASASRAARRRPTRPSPWPRAWRWPPTPPTGADARTTPAAWEAAAAELGEAGPGAGVVARSGSGAGSIPRWLAAVVAPRPGGPPAAHHAHPARRPRGRSASWSAPTTAG